MLLVGIDGGNNTIITSVEGKNPLIIPTVYSNYKEVQDNFTKKSKSLQNSLDVEIELNCKNNKTRKNLGRFLVGKLAKESEGSRVNVRSIGKSKSGDIGLLVCMLTSLAVVTVEHQNITSGTLTQDIKMVTGLPYNQYRTDHDSYISQFIGCHKVIFRGQYNIEVEVNIVDVVVEVEGAGALNKLIVDDIYSEYSDEDLVDRAVLGIEVGEFTSEILAIVFKEDEDGSIQPEYKANLCTGIDLGIANAKQPIIELFREKYQTIIDRYDIDLALSRTARRGYIDFDANISEMNSLNIIEPYSQQLQSLAESIAIIINNKIKNSGIRKGTIIHSLIYGGGACVLDYRFGNILKEKIDEIIGIKSSIAENPHLSNSLGFLEKAKYVFED